MASMGCVARLLQPFAAAAVVIVLSACGGGGGGGGGSAEPVRTVTSVAVTSPTQNVKQGDTVQLTAVARDQFGAVIAGNTVTWSSSVPSVATVSSTGLLQALAGGSVTITATISGVSGTLALTITPRVTTTVTVSSPTASPAVGETVQLTVVARDQFGDVLAGRTATWSTSNATVATISSTGLLQAVAPGAVIATVTIDGVPGSLSLTVTPRAVASVTVTSPKPSLEVGESVQLVATARDTNGDVMPGTTASWSTSNAGIATVSATGVLQGQSTGTVVITATINGVSGSLPLTITPRVTASLTITSPTLTLGEGDRMQLTATARDASGAVVSGRTVTWASVNADITPSGLLWVLARGTVVVTATIDGISATQSLTVTAPIKVNVSIGAKEVVFRYATDRCEAMDTPDGPSRAVRAEDGSLVLFAGNGPRVFVSRGADFGSLRRDCSRPVLESADLRTPESYENWEWIWAVYREGSRWHAFISNEFHDTVSGTCQVGDPSPANPCWYNSATHAVSTDGARTFAKPQAPAHVIAPPPYAWVPPTPSTPTSPIFPGKYFEGYQPPLNVFRALDGYYYASMWVTPSKEQPSSIWPSAMRTDNLDDPASWRAWDGDGFNLRLTSPYVTGTPGPLCGRLWSPLGDYFNTYLSSYVQVSQGSQRMDGKKVCGVFYRLSANLLVWSPPQFIVQTKEEGCDFDPQRPGLLEPVPVMYVSLIDHADPTVNFERPGRMPYLYYVRFNRGDMSDPMYWLDRDLVRVPITFTRVD